MLRRHNTSNKYGAKKTIIDGITFDSTVEGERYLYLKQLQEQGSISNLETHKTYELLPKQTRTETIHLKTKDKTVTRTVFQNIEFTPDFIYTDSNGTMVAEDVKGSLHCVSADFPLRRKLLYHKYGIYVNVMTYTKKNGWQRH